VTEPQTASDYDDRTTVAVKKVLLEIGQILGLERLAWWVERTF
jgi:hypothetical protein